MVQLYGKDSEKQTAQKRGIRMDTRPKYLVLSDWIRERIRDGSFVNGQKLPSEHEFSSTFEVSRQTVRQAISLLVNEKLLVPKRGSGTYVSFEQKVSRPVTKNIAVITTYFNEYIFPGVIKGIDKVLREYGYHMNLGITYNQTNNEQTLLSSMLAGGVDGFLIEPTKSAFPNPNMALYQQIMQAHIPVVFLNGYYPSMDFPYVTIDDYASGKLATRCLLNHGHRELFGIFKSDDIQGHFRYSGFVNAVKECGCLFEDRQVLWYVTEDLDKLFSPENDAYLLERIGSCSGIVCYNDEIAVHLMEVFRRNGKRVPKDYSIVSFDNSNLSNLGEVGLTSVDYPAEQIGAEAALKLLRSINGHYSERNLSIAPTLLERGSVTNR